MLLIRRLVWDGWNVAHIGRHDVTRQEVEAVCHGQPIVQVGKKGRNLILGPTGAGRMLTVVLDPVSEQQPGVYYPVTARPASRRERAVYEAERGRVPR